MGLLASLRLIEGTLLPYMEMKRLLLECSVDGWKLFVVTLQEYSTN